VEHFGTSIRTLHGGGFQAIRPPRTREFWPDFLFQHALQSSLTACIRHNGEHSTGNLYPTLKRLPHGLDQV
jgi:hypothetical protein